MKAMNRMRKLARRNFSGLTHVQIAKRTGVSPSTAGRFMRGVDGSMVIAKYLAATYGGEFDRLLQAHKVEESRRIQKQMIHARECASAAFPPPSAFVPMAIYEMETHPLTDISAFPTMMQRFCGYLEIAA